ncbi:cytochrome P450 [Streptomyces flavidovirens]|uniref:cytochrome P450 n=1 Tax=Streptomyces flavidovirens TaxID=67298 RepID=UPI00342E3A82
MDQRNPSVSECPFPHDPAPVHGALLAQDPRAVYGPLRQRWGAIAPIELAPGVEAWLVMGYQEALELVWNERAFSSDARRWRALTEGLLPEDSPLLPILGWRPALSRLDDQAHRQQRQVVTETLDRVDVRRLRALVRQQAEATVDQWAMHGAADLVNQYGQPLVWSVLGQLLGLADSQTPMLIALVSSIVGSAAEAAQAEAELMQLLRHLVAVKRETPGPDFASWLSHSARLTDAEVAHNLAAILFSGGQSTINWLSGTMWLLLTDTGLSSALATGRLTVSDAVDRALWACSPLPNIAGRWARNAVVFAGCRIAAGDLLIPCLAAANTDPAIHGAGNLGTNRAHLAFGTGAHGCPAKEAARLIVETAVDVLLRRLNEVRPGVADTDLRWRPSLWGAAPASLPTLFQSSRPQRSTTDEASHHAVMAVPEKRQDDRATDTDPAPQRWGWWNSNAGW